MRIPLIILTLIVFSTSAFAKCTTNEYGRVECSNGAQAGGFNANTGHVWDSERSQNGIATTQTSRGGRAKTKNGKGVYRSPNGKNCYKTASSHGCS